MDWFAYALIGAAAIGATGIIDKYLLSRYVRSSVSYLMSLVIIQQLFAFLVLVFQGADFIYPYSVFALLAGFVQVVLWLAYLKALQADDVSRVMPLVFIYPLFLFGAAALFLGEAVAPQQFAGGILLVLGAVLVEYNPSKMSISISPALKYMLFFWVFLALYALLAKYLLSFMGEWQLYFWSSIGSLLFCSLFLAKRSIRAEVRGLFGKGRRIVGTMLAEEALDFLGRIAVIFAYAAGPIALVASVGALQPFIVLLYVIGLSAFMPGILHEEIGKETLALKFVAAILVAAGIYLVT